ncbi:hypothetical protein EKO04_004549 [Ascochyta lentis]|uniref:Uncharacterized protein n=1 Tax=Ascochyta lentis TaxID=205686 RepID=A0A8H7MHU6_9PLEO|nr:hypothetical protein EKO04_004549 [Ascochyta lentis]
MTAYSGLLLIVAQQYSASFGNESIQAWILKSKLGCGHSQMRGCQALSTSQSRCRSDDAMNLEDDDIPKMIKVRPLPTHGNRDSTSLKSSSASVTHMPLSHTYYENEISRKEYEFGMCRKELEDAYDEIMVKDRRI